jgi:hypothetical protein
VRAVRSIAPKLDRPDLHDLVQKVENAAAVEDDRAFLEAAFAFLESWSQSRR